jgi:hypothetical protein
MTGREIYLSPTLVGKQTLDLWQPQDLMHPCRKGSIGKKAWNKDFKPDKLNGSRIVAVDVEDKMRGCPWQLHLLHQQRAELTGKQDLNKTFKPDTTDDCRIVGTINSLQNSRRDMPRRRDDMPHIYLTYSCKGRLIVIRRHCSIRHTWMNCDSSESIKGRWKNSNIRPT